MVLWKGKRNQQTSGQAHQEEKWEDSNKKIRNVKGDATTDTIEIQKIKNCKGILWIIICQQIGQPRKKWTSF